MWSRFSPTAASIGSTRSSRHVSSKLEPAPPCRAARILWRPPRKHEQESEDLGPARSLGMLLFASRFSFLPVEHGSSGRARDSLYDLACRLRGSSSACTNGASTWRPPTNRPTTGVECALPGSRLLAKCKHGHCQIGLGRSIHSSQARQDNLADRRGG